MKFIILHLFSIFCLIQWDFCQSQTYTVDDYLRDINIYEANSLNWSFPVNSKRYAKGSDNKQDLCYDGTYDFIICGGGTSGAVLINRLSAIKKWKILVLEAGSYEDKIAEIPGMVDYLRTSDYNWGYNTNSQQYSQGYTNNSIATPRGNALGGSSVINAMIYTRGSKYDYDNWAAQGCPGWSYDEVLPYFKKSENATFPDPDPKYHGKNGNINVEYSRIVDEVGLAFLDAQREMNRSILDYNGENQTGFGILQFTEKFGQRDSGGKGYILPIQNRTNLCIKKNALVTKIMINNRKEAYGVKYYQGGKQYWARAKKEVIVSAGAFNSPQLLMLSGIGPKSHLEKHGIKVIRDLPVGKNLYDHLLFTSNSYRINYTYVNDDQRTLVEKYLQGKGDFTSPDNCQCIGYIKLNETSKTSDVEHVFHTFNPTPKPYIQYSNFYRYTKETYETCVKPTEGISQFSMHSVLLHPECRGYVELTSSSPFDFPIINPNYLCNERDQNVLVAAIKDQIKIANTAALQKYNATIIKIIHPNCQSYQWNTDDFWRCMVKNLANTIHHFGGTCKMGQKEDPTTVVDPKLKVHGIKKLRVIDCSVIPVTVSGHTMAPAYMLGEKGSHMIIDEHIKKGSSECKSSEEHSKESSSEEDSSHKSEDSKESSSGEDSSHKSKHSKESSGEENSSHKSKHSKEKSSKEDSSHKSKHSKESSSKEDSSHKSKKSKGKGKEENS